MRALPSFLHWVLAFCLVALLAPAAARAQTLPPATDVFNQITVGWNLGNSMESLPNETGFGNPVVTQQVIDAVKHAGFNAIRIPCAWDIHADQTTFQIDPAWMARVKQVVDFAINDGMFVMLNIHWDGGWLEDHPTFDFQTIDNQKQQAYWTQIANEFKTYDQHLLFAASNETHADFGTPSTENITVQQSYLQTFVNAVRATGGNNASRTLVVQTYNTNMQFGLQFFSLPTDTIANRLIVETHYYDPFDFTLNPTGSCLFWGAPFPVQSDCSWAYEPYVTNLYSQVNAQWTAKGVPVIIGEYGVATRPNLSLDARNYWLQFINQTAAANGFKTFYWDNGVLPSATNGFALVDRNTAAMTDQNALEAILRGSGVGDPNLQFTLTTTVNGSGTVTTSPKAATYAGGTAVTLTAAPAAGFDFAGWTGPVQGMTNPITMKVVANTTVVANFVPHGTLGTGTILREFWLNAAGSTTADLIANANFPNNPSGSSQLTTLEGPTNFADAYGTRIRGYIHPPVSGAYTFWLASDDGGDLFLSTSTDPANATRIAFVDSWTNPREYTKLASQQSVAINLVAGQKYYIEVLQKEGGGGDNVSVAWQGPGIPQAVIPGIYMSPFVVTGGGGGTTTTLTVTKAGTGTGTVTSSPAGISCGSSCVGAFTTGTSVTLTAAAASGSTFAGWSGACTGTAACTVSMAAAQSVTATFNTAATTTQTLTVTRAGTGSGTVTSSPAGISCGSTCSASFTTGASVTLTAAAATGSTFAGWSGACTGTGACTVSMTAAKAVTATFNTAATTTQTLTVTRAGTGSGTVASSPAGISCGTTCSASFTTGASVTLTATAASGSTFAGWSGACTGTATCTVSMTAAQSVTATFNTAVTGTPCANPITFSRNTGNFNTAGAVCYRTSDVIAGWGCFNFDGRTIAVGGQPSTCGQMPVTRSADGFVYFSATAGQFPWAGLFTF
ncbi:MAG TPA: cellulase family glycosylhydrolase [Kofleriaceae bacterium]|nr:cellulase family glycosylhydrolase [Kofleriaceae bacterium]